MRLMPPPGGVFFACALLFIKKVLCFGFPFVCRKRSCLLLYAAHAAAGHPLSVARQKGGKERAKGRAGFALPLEPLLIGRLRACLLRGRSDGGASGCVAQ